jgi:hypothetical protein
MSHGPGPEKDPHSCTLETAAEVVRHHLHALWEQPERAALIPPVMLWGPPGVGKSAIVREICRAEGIGFLDVRLAQREPIDIRGLPVPRDGVVHWMLPAEWPRDEASRGIILFDELSAADRTLQVAAYEFLLDRRLGDLYRVPDGWYLMAAGNRASDRAVAAPISSALANRFLHLDIAADLEVWVRWASERGLPPELIAFLRFRPSCFFDLGGDPSRGWPSPRSWERVALELELAQGLGSRVLRAAVVGLVGPGAALELFAFLTQIQSLPDVRAMLRGELPVAVPERADRRFAFCQTLVYWMWKAEDRAAALRAFFEALEALPPDFGAMLLLDALNGRQREEIAALATSPRFAAWTKQHGAVFRPRLRMHGDAAARSAAGVEGLGGGGEEGGGA